MLQREEVEADPIEVEDSRAIRFPIEIQGVYAWAWVRPPRKFAGVGVEFTSATARKLFDLAFADRGEIEEEYGQPLRWETGKWWRRVFAELPSTKSWIKEDWDRQHTWMAEQLDRVFAVLVPLRTVAESSAMTTAPAELTVNEPKFSVSSKVIDVPLKSALPVTVKSMLPSSVIAPVESR